MAYAGAADAQDTVIDMNSAKKTPDDTGTKNPDDTGTKTLDDTSTKTPKDTSTKTSDDSNRKTLEYTTTKTPDDNTTKIASRLHSPLSTSEAQIKWLLSWHFLLPFACFVVFCVTGPLMIHLLDALILARDTAACDVDPVWSSWSTIFQINIRTGHISFTAAKIIDIAFDLVVGRAGQAILALMSYRVYTDVFTYLAERRPVPYHMFKTVTIQPTNLSSLRSYALAMFSKQGSKLMLLWLIATVTYFLAYPTLVSASTSLVGATMAAIALPDNATAPLADYLNSAAYKFTNSGLTNEPNPWIVYTMYIHKLPDDTPTNILYINAGNTVGSNGRGYGGHYNGFDDYDTLIVNSTTYTIPNSTIIQAGFYYSGTFYLIDPAKNNGSDSLWIHQLVCLPDGQRYQWGASYELLCIIVICQILWSTAMLTVWGIACMNSARIQSGRKIGLYTAILLLAEPIRQKASEIDYGEKLSREGDLDNENEVKKIVRTIGGVRYETINEASGEEGHARKYRRYGSLKEA